MNGNIAVMMIQTFSFIENDIIIHKYENDIIHKYEND